MKMHNTLKLFAATIALIAAALAFAGPGDFGGWTYGNNGQITGVVSNRGIVTPIPPYLTSGTIANALCSDANGNIIPNAGANCYGGGGGGSGTVTSLSVVSANGLAGSVSNPTTTPAITLGTTLTGIIKGNGTSFLSATAGTDYVAPGGALGTPSSATLTNATGLPITGLTGLGTGAGTALGNNVSGSGSICLTTSCALTTPNLGTPSAAVLTNATGTAAGLTAGNVTTNANLTGPITSVGNTTSVGAQTGTGSTFVMQTSPSITSPTITGGSHTGGTLSGTSTTFDQYLYSSAVPIGIPSSGSIGNNGALTGVTAFQTTYSNGIYLYFPANAISSGSAAGLYWTVMSSTTAGTIYNNTYTGGIPAVVGSPTAFVTTGPGAYTQTITANITLASVSLVAGTMGINSRIRSTAAFSCTNNANSKSGSTLLASTAVGGTIPYASSAGGGTIREIQNRGSLTSNFTIISNALSSNNSGTPTYTSVNTGNTQTLSIVAQISTATDYMVLENGLLELFY